VTHQLTIHLSRAEGALVRLLGLTERRGFSTLSITAIPMGAELLLVHLTLRAQRSLENLVHQIDKLYDVQRVEIP
jgi:acetolactate synthase II small subunit